MPMIYIITAGILAALTVAFFHYRKKKAGARCRKISKTRAGLCVAIIALMAVFCELTGFAGGLSPLLIAAGAVLIALG